MTPSGLPNSSLTLRWPSSGPLPWPLPGPLALNFCLQRIRSGNFSGRMALPLGFPSSKSILTQPRALARLCHSLAIALSIAFQLSRIGKLSGNSLWESCLAFWIPQYKTYLALAIVLAIAVASAVALAFLRIYLEIPTGRIAFPLRLPNVDTYTYLASAFVVAVATARTISLPSPWPLFLLS